MSRTRGNSQRIQHRRGSAAEWTVNNPILFAGELGYETDTTRIKFGDGVTQWVNLAYVGQFGANDLDGLTDVSITSPASGAVLRYDGTSWIDAVLSKSDVGLSNVDNTSDTNKPVSAAQATADAAVASAASSDATSKANAAQAAAIQRANHTGTQPASTITGLAASATTDTTNAANIGSGVLPAARLPAATTTTVGGVVIGSGLGVASGTVSVTYGTASGTACQGNDARLSDARVPTSHTHTVSQVTDAGTIATQNANSVAITGGSINGTTIGATTASTGVFTAVTVIGAGDAGFGAVTTGGNIAHITLQNQSTGGRSYSMRAWGSAGSGALGIDDLTANARRFTIDSAGNVGVGTASPAARLDVAGADSAVRVGTGSYGRVQMSGGNADGFLYGSFAALGDGVHLGYNYYANAAGTGVISNAGGPTSRVTVGYGFVAFATSSAINTAPTERVRIDGSGNVGIGTASPSSRLHVLTPNPTAVNEVARFQGGVDSSNFRCFVSFYTTNPNFWWELSNEDASGGITTNGFAFRERSSAASVPRMYLAQGGNVGIGTTSPGAKLHVAGSNQGIFIEDTGANRAVLGLYAFNNELRIQGTAYVNAAQPLTVWTANAERMRIDANGNVGIGTTSPSSLLHVQRTLAANDWNAITVANAGGWSAASGNAALINVTDGTGTIGKFGVTYDATNRGAFVVRSLFAGGYGASGDVLYARGDGNVGIGTASPTISSGVGLHLAGSTLRLGTARTPASSTATGNQGEVCWDSSYLYVCIATNTWRRIALTTW